VNPWRLVTKYRIRPCRCAYRGRFCGKWFIDDMFETPGIPGTFESWHAALDAVIREQTRQYYQQIGHAEFVDSCRDWLKTRWRFQ
jgi:hypothetical protein